MENYEKKYKELVKNFSSVLKLQSVKESGIISVDDVRKLIPELKESEDEIMKEVIHNLIVSNDYTSSSKEIFSVYNKTKEDCLAWLEKQGEQKPAVWSEEDERIYNEIIDFFLGDIETRCATIDKQRHFGYWLKSIKPQKHWKPSEEQLRAIINSAQGLYQCKEKEVLLDLYEQLKNL